MKTVDLNCDLGEGFGAWEMGNDPAMIELATSVNIACGFHAGDPDIMRKTVELAKARGVSVGAHPGYRDLHGFGRRPMPGLKSSEIENLIAYQIGALQAIATAAGYKVTHVKAHGAISNVACEDDMTAKAIANGIKAVDPNLIFVVLANSKLVQAGEGANLPMGRGGCADPAFERHGCRRVKPPICRSCTRCLPPAPMKTTARWYRARSPVPCCTTRRKSPTAWCGWCRTARWCRSPAR